MAESRFVYVTYIRTTPEKLWQALIDPEFTRQFWVRDVAGLRLEARGVLAADDPRRARCRQRRGRRDRPAANVWCSPGGTSSGPSCAKRAIRGLTYELEPQGEAVKLTVIHEIEQPDSKFIEAVSNGWPMILLSSLKSLLETGESLVEMRTWPKGA